MTKHLPECPSESIVCEGEYCLCDYAHFCCCDALRACEKRVREDEQSHNFSPDIHWDGMSEAYQRGLDAAREAVAVVRGKWVFGPRIYKHEVLTAIDAGKAYGLTVTGYTRGLDAGSKVITVAAIAKVLAWVDGCTPEEIASAATNAMWMESAQACFKEINHD